MVSSWENFAYIVFFFQYSDALFSEGLEELPKSLKYIKKHDLNI